MPRARHQALLLCGLIASAGGGCRPHGRASTPSPSAANAPRAASAPTAPAAPAHPPGSSAPPDVHEAAPASLFAELLRELGVEGPVAIVPAADGVTAVSLIGGHRKLLVPGPVRWVFVDDRSHVVWFQRDVGSFSELWALDLTRAAPEPERIITQLPRGEAVAVGYAAAGPEADDIVRSTVSEYDGRCELWLHATRPATKFVEGLYDHLFDRVNEHRAAVAKAVIVADATPRLQELAVRGQDRRLLLQTSAPARTGDAPAVAADRCEQPELCGTAETIPGSGLLRVLIAHSCGDACHVQWQLYDPETREFIDFRTQQRSAQPIAVGRDASMSDAYISRDGAGLVVDGDVFRTGGGQVFDGTGNGGGWLGGQSHTGP